jgi:GT2 family glycosyltransferase
MTVADWPTGVRMVNLREPLQPMAGVESYTRVRVFVRDGPDLIGAVDIWNGRASISAARLRTTIIQSLGYALGRRAIARSVLTVEAPASLPVDVRVSIIVPTCDRAADLRHCLASLVSQESRRPLEIVVVDNQPGRGPARAVAREFPGIVLVEESKPGLSYARNAGFAAATGSILVATDDDVVAPPDWVEKIVAPFARPDVAAVTGQVLPLELETESQCRFEDYGGLGRGFDPKEVNGLWFRSFRGAVPTWSLGATANAAFRASVLAEPAIGVLDEALGAGMPTGCSEDTYLFYKILKAGHTIVYEPSAYVWHRHRRTMESLRRQIYSYSKGHVAYHLTTLMRDGDTRALVRLGWSLPKTYVRRAFERLRGRSGYPLSLIGVEIAGNLAGPWALYRARRRVRHLGSGRRLDPDRRQPPADVVLRDPSGQEKDGYAYIAEKSRRGW